MGDAEHRDGDEEAKPERDQTDQHDEEHHDAQGEEVPAIPFGDLGALFERLNRPDLFIEHQVAGLTENHGEDDPRNDQKEKAEDDHHAEQETNDQIVDELIPATKHRLERRLLAIQGDERQTREGEGDPNVGEAPERARVEREVRRARGVGDGIGEEAADNPRDDEGDDRRADPEPRILFKTLPAILDRFPDTERLRGHKERLVNYQPLALMPFSAACTCASCLEDPLPRAISSLPK